jgi:hypothetical protein
MNPTSVRPLILILVLAILPSCKTVKFKVPDDDTPSAAKPETLGGIPSHR